MKGRGVLSRFRRGAAVAGIAAGVAWANGGLVNSAIPFELDGNATKNNSGDDWQNVNATGGASKAHTGVAYDPSNFSGGTTVTDPSTFVQGAKDTDDIGAWHSGPGSIPPKDDIVTAYAAAYNVGGHLIISFGADRFANNGSAQLGFWFFQGSATAPASGSKGVFSGSHQAGDILALVNFEQGGGVPNIQIYQWDGGKDPLTLLTASVGKCGDPAATDACAITNDTVPVSLYWPSTFKFPATGPCADPGTVSCAPLVSFFEGEIDVTALLHGITPCFTTFMSETRSSTSISASLEDYVVHQINICGLSVAKTCDTGFTPVVHADGTIDYRWNVAVTNTGFGALSNVTVLDTPPAGSSNLTVTPASVSSLDGGSTANFVVTLSVKSLNAMNQASAKGAIASGGTPGACGDAGTVCATTPSADTCHATVVNTISITKACGVPVGYPIPGSVGNVTGTALPGTQLVSQAGFAVAKVNFSGQITNSGDTDLTNVLLTDDPAADSISVAWPGAAGTIPKGASVSYSGTYRPSGVAAGDLGLGVGRYGFNDHIYVTGATAQIGNNPPDATCSGSNPPAHCQAADAATCHICTNSPDGQCSIAQ